MSDEATRELFDMLRDSDGVCGYYDVVGQRFCPANSGFEAIDDYAD